ncbi:TSC complex subunit 1a isoform X1 [Scleropages formosus]|uniref:TSC complex subunit 1a isoform X1 n=1 Tax=Scleropages formosus TaxID=113540 RepID=UPI0008787055|nr:hamartin isoform X1 [Scleropages formosus]XP_029115292.1 hamartin isoform X1 [Scleropages formosus]XP_029115293.1 hamartin isoform X1 [Scleropages formosus]XP_029115294.1 hamartin isoform X1 [Scleropages formosus]
MAREQSSIGELLPLLDSSDLHQLDEVKGLINEQLSTERGSALLNSLVDYYLETSSSQALSILSSVREPHDKHLLDKMSECMTKQSCRLHTLTLLGHVVRRQPPWIHKISRFSLLPSLLKCLKTDSDVVMLITGVLVLVTLLPVIPQVSKQHLHEFFDIFGRLAAWNPKNAGHVPEVFLIHLHASVYSLFHRLYGMYPCNFVSYLRSHYSTKENMDTFEEVVKPMLQHVRIHPELVSGTKDHELDPTRWKRYEIHDIVIECAKVSLDPKEASCEEDYSTVPEHFLSHLQLRPLECTASSFTDLHSSYGSCSSTPFLTPRQPFPLPLTSSQPTYRSPQSTLWQTRNQNGEVGSSCVVKDIIWSPSSVCSMTTPPSSRGISPVSELSHSAPHFLSRVHTSLAGGKRTPSSSTPGTSSSTPTFSEDYVHISLPTSTSTPPCKDTRPTEHVKPSMVRQEPVSELERNKAELSHAGDSESSKAMTLPELSIFIRKQELEQHEHTEKEQEEDAIREELRKIAEEQQDLSALCGFHSPFCHATETLTEKQEKVLVGSTPNLHSEPYQAVSTPDQTARPVLGTSARTLEQQMFTPIDHTPSRHIRLSPLVPDEEISGLAKHGFCPLSTCREAAPAYEDLFGPALPRAASLFVAKKTSEARWAASTEMEEKESEGVAAASPLEVLDRLIQQGSDAHDKVLRRLPLPSKSADWTHFGGKQQNIKTKAGSTPPDELHTLRSQLLLLHNQVLYERYKREQHAIRNRRLLRRIINATALEEQNNAMKDQLKLQDIEIQSLQVSLQEEQQCYRQLWEDRESAVMQLRSQILQLQQGRDEYYTKYQELQSKLLESQKRMGELEAKLQKANNKICNTGHQLSQLSIKLTNSETLQQQMGFLNKQLVLLSEVNKLCVEELQHVDPVSSKEVDMLQVSAEKELEKLRQSLTQQSQRLDAAHQRIGELEAQLIKKEHLIAEQKLFLEDVKSQAKEQLQASESRYQAQKQVSQMLQAELLQLYSKLELENPVGGSLPTGGTPESCKLTDSRPDSDCSLLQRGQVIEGTQGTTGASSVPPTDTGCTLPTGRLQTRTAANISDCPQSPAAPLESSPSHLPFLMSRPSGTPLAVGSYPSAKSFLGLHSRELFRNKSESHCEEGFQPLAGLSQGLKTKCVEPTEDIPMTCSLPGIIPAQATVANQIQPDAEQSAISEWDSGSEPGSARQRQERLKIMDYNDLH